MAATAAATSPAAGGSPRRKRSVSRTHPMSIEHVRTVAPHGGRDLGGPAADVDDHDAVVPVREVGRGAGVGQLALLLSRQQLGGGAHDVGRGAEEVLAVGGVAYRRRRHQSGSGPPPRRP